MSTGRFHQFQESYKYFLKMQNEGKLFSIADIAKATGWSESTVRTYRTKKWSDVLTTQPNKWFSADVSAYTEDAYIRMMSQNYKQSLEPFKPNLPEQVEELAVKSRDSAILAIDIYNRPIVAFRSQGYIVMMIIAWTALFHAICELEKKEWFYKNKDGSYIIIDGDKKAWDLAKCIDECENMISEAAKKNLYLFISLRNKTEHRYVPAFDLDILGECQAMLINFENLITEKFGSYYALNNALSFPLQVTTVRQEAQVEAIKKVQSQHYNELREYIKTYRGSLDDDIYSDSQYSYRVFLIPKVGNHRSSSDCAVEFVKLDPNNPDEFEAKMKDIALIRDRHVPVANQGKLRPQMVCDALSDRMDKEIKVHLHTKAWKTYNVRKQGKQAEGCDTKYCQFDEPHSDYVYTQAWVDFLFSKLSDPKEFERVQNYKG